MKKTNALWGGISILIGVVIAILSLLHGVWATVALITVFSAWGLGLIFAQLIPSWKSNRTYRRARPPVPEAERGLGELRQQCGTGTPAAYESPHLGTPAVVLSEGTLGMDNGRPRTVRRLWRNGPHPCLWRPGL